MIMYASEELRLRSAAKKTGFGIEIRHIRWKKSKRRGQRMWLTLTEKRDYDAFWREWRRLRGDA